MTDSTPADVTQCCSGDGYPFLEKPTVSALQVTQQQFHLTYWCQSAQCHINEEFNAAHGMQEPQAQETFS